MRLINYLEKNNIATKEILQVYGTCIYFYLLSLLLTQYDFSWLALSLLIIVHGGMANLCVIYFNNNSMPVLVSDRKELKQIERKIKDPNSIRHYCIFNERTKLKVLADRLHFRKGVYSLGDFVIFIGIALAVLSFISVTANILSSYF